MSDIIFNVHTIEHPEGMTYGYFFKTQFNSYSHPDYSIRRNDAMTLAESLVAKGQPVVVRETLPGTRCDSLIWQSFNAKDNQGLLE